MSLSEMYDDFCRLMGDASQEEAEQFERYLKKMGYEVQLGLSAQVLDSDGEKVEDAKFFELLQTCFSEGGN